MLKPYKGECKQCEKDNKWIANSKGICADCVYLNNHGGKTKVEVYRERQKGKPKGRKKTGEGELFLEIWDERPHYCTNCKDPLGNEPVPHYFSHIKSKGAYPELRLVKTNIELLCLQCHSLWDFGTKEEFKKRTRK